MSATIIIVRRRKQLIRRFAQTQATDPEHAVTLSELGLRPTWIFRQMVRAGVFVLAVDPAGGDSANATAEPRYYMDHPLAIDFMRSRRRRTLVLSALTVLGMLFFLLVWAIAMR